MLEHTAKPGPCATASNRTAAEGGCSCSHDYEASPDRARVDLSVNGVNYSREIPVNMTLLRFIREDLGLTGTKEGCGAGECGACTIIMNGQTVNSCIVLAVEAHNAVIETVEGQSEGTRLSDLQQAFIRNHAVQCGFCTPGMLMSIKHLLDSNPRPSRHEIQEAIEGNFCRCTGYQQIIEAVLDHTGQLEAGEGDLRHV
ncbi:MAG: (2Fe-2S)-binding protein [Candidatus Wallbacteria bacterium HGW-Wallbacteria-1]|jgi:carbon-monoxide dehydrogenase small subunit|uniref:(2Fe-2S)-binding protein n=1 Tax=Candidatus Wallbacteria bacterium HGW-Wallbacteria-1 TaxID=2013854 RepID=A0A2N1PPW9_9BACT|nr:MAG: (2Fe-2S)-binding protein [Candidatus Wallbacteria bacterium HGW-Wallbacteria-1]